MEQEKIIGLSEVKGYLEDIVARKEIYTRCNVTPDHLILSGLKSGNGRSLVAKWMTDEFLKHRLRPFTAIDPSLAYKTNGKMDNLDQIFSDIETASVYENHYRGLVFLDIDALAEHVNEAQVSYFIENVREIGAYATLVFFMDDTRRNANLLMEKIKGALVNVKTLSVAAYTVEELAQITRQMVESHNIIADDSAEIIMGELILERHISTAKECEYLSRELVQYADTKTNTPILTGFGIVDKVEEGTINEK